MVQHDRLEHLGIAGFPLKFVVKTDLPIRLDSLLFSALQDQLCKDMLLTDAGQSMSVGVYLLIARRIHGLLFHRPQCAEFFLLALFPAVTKGMYFLLKMLRRLRCRLILRFRLHIKQAELMMPIVKDVRPLLAALSGLVPLTIQDDFPEPLNLIILLLAFLSECTNDALQHGLLLLNCKMCLRLLHTAFTTLHT